MIFMWSGTRDLQILLAELIKAPTAADISDCTRVSCGVDFTVWLCKGQLFSAGNPQFGQLGHGTDHEYNAKDCEPYTPATCARLLLHHEQARVLSRSWCAAASVKLMYQPQPTPEAIKTFKDTTIVNFSCGHNHVVALDSEKRAWSWGEPARKHGAGCRQATARVTR